VDSFEEFRPEFARGYASPHPQTSSLLLFSANTEKSLQQLIKNHQAYLENHPSSLDDLSHTLASHRERLPFRSFSIAQTGSKVTTSPALKTTEPKRDLVMVFSGQGAQWPQMGIELIQVDHGFKQDILAMDDILRKVRYPPEWSIESMCQLSLFLIVSPFGC
jgi:acyl transferase domain-containing protein